MTCFGIALVIFVGRCIDPNADAAAQRRVEFCRTYTPVYWSAADTRKTKEQVDRNNRIWKALCSPKK